MTSDGPRTWFPEFYTNVFATALSGLPRWTISAQLGLGAEQTRKAPIDMRHLIDGCRPSCQHTGPVRGAWASDERCLVTLDELTQTFPEATNVAYYLRSAQDGFVVLDIEPDCPPEVTEALLALPGILYSELSMSGRGYHLIMSPPQNVHDFSVAATKRVLRHEQGWYEILFEHFCTFTRTPVPHVRPPAGTALAEPGRYASLETVYAHLAQTAKISVPTPKLTIDVDAVDISDIPMGEIIVSSTLQRVQPQLKSPDDFHHDLSRWEFSVLGKIYNAMQPFLRAFRQAGHTFDETAQIRLLHAAAQETLPARAKHRELRRGNPYLVDRAAALVAQRSAARDDSLNHH